MAAVLLIREDPPVGTGGIVPASENSTPEQRRPSASDPAESSTLPKDWSPVASSPGAESETPAPPKVSRPV
jgi:hypothetical protein